MSTTAIYFPYVNIEKTPWLGRVLLYWENVFCLTPPAFLKPELKHRLQPHMQELLRSGLLEWAAPAELVYGSFPDEFLETLSKQEDLPDRRIRFQNGEHARVYLAKVDGHLARIGIELSELRLADLRPSAWVAEGWFNVEQRTADN